MELLDIISEQKEEIERLETALKDALDTIERMQNGKALHSDCHDSVCNGSRYHPRGASGVTCSCRSRDERNLSLQSGVTRWDNAPLCSECKWFQEDVGDPSGETHGCMRANMYTEDVRYLTGPNGCGPEGRYWEKRL